MVDPTGLDNPTPTAAAPFIAELNACFASPPDPASVGRHDIQLHLLDRAGSDQLMSQFQRKRLVRMNGGVLLDALLDTGEEKNEGLVYSAIRSLAPVDLELLARLVSHPDLSLPNSLPARSPTVQHRPCARSRRAPFLSWLRVP